MNEPPRKKFFNNEKKEKTNNPLKPKTQDDQKPNKDVWGDSVKKPEKVNAWTRNNLN